MIEKPLPPLGEAQAAAGEAAYLVSAYLMSFSTLCEHTF